MEKWDDRLGLHTHDDGTMKIAGRIFRDASIMLRSIEFKYYDSEKRISYTDKGILSATLGEHPHKGNKIYHFNDNDCFAAMDSGSISHNGKTLISSDNEAYLFFFTENGSFECCDIIFFKAEKQGVYSFHHDGIINMELIDFTPDGICTLDPVSFSRGPGFASVTLNAAMEGYWLKIVTTYTKS